MQPKKKAVQSVFWVVWLCSSIIQPNRIIMAFNVKMTSSSAMSYMPNSIAIATIITDELNAYSIHRA